MGNLLLIDDEVEHRKSLAAAIVSHDSQIEIREWSPAQTENPLEEFNKRVDDDTVLVITDYDLTKGGITGLFGATIVGWCQSKSIPVGDFSRGKVSQLPKEPNQYEIRVPTNDDEAARYVAGVFRGFESINEAVKGSASALNAKKSPVGVLAEILGRSQEESRFSLYGVRLGASNPSLKEHIRTQSDPQTPEKQRLLAYVIGHLLLNVILRYPGPIMGANVLASYVAASTDEVDDLATLFADARYKGPFDQVDQFFWLSDVDSLLETLVTEVGEPPEAETQGELRRLAVEWRLGRKLRKHGCTRCGGKNGGFWCPFTERAVCQLPECSIGSNAWIPQGARLCRIEKDFYDEWAPVLGF
jgi:hypothetical protein